MLTCDICFGKDEKSQEVYVVKGFDEKVEIDEPEVTPVKVLAKEPVKEPVKEPEEVKAGTKEEASTREQPASATTAPVETAEVAVEIAPFKDPDVKMAEDKPPEAKGSCGRCRERYEQQEPARNMIPYWIFCWHVQASCAACCAIILALIGICLIMATSSCLEITVPYKYPDYKLKFEVSEEMKGPVLMWYDIPNVYLNQKRYVENKDNDVIKPFMIGANVCDDADHFSEVSWRRVVIERESRESLPDKGLADDKFSQLVRRSELDGVFKPCGLNSLSMFTDEYELYKSEGTQKKQVELDETDIVLEHDEDIFTKKIDEVEDGPVRFHIKGERSWLEKGAFYDHWKVWMRSPASPRVRQLWARIPDGLSKGTYEVVLRQNSAIWTAPGGWGVAEKSIVFSTSNTFGSKGASNFLGILSLVLAILEAFMAIFFMVTPLLQAKKDAA